MEKGKAYRAFYHFFAMRLINLIILEHEFKFLFIVCHLNYLKILFLAFAILKSLMLVVISFPGATSL